MGQTLLRGTCRLLLPTEIHPVVLESHEYVNVYYFGLIACRE